MKASALLQESPDPFLRSNGNPDPSAAPSPSQAATQPIKEEPARFPDPKALLSVIGQESCLPFSIMLLRTESPCPELERELAGLADTPEKKILVAQEQDVFFIFLHQKGSAEAKCIFHRLKQHQHGLLSAGIYSHPLANFSSSMAIGYGRKALAHSLLLGPGSVAEFDAVSLNISGDEAYQKGHIKDAIAEYEAALTLDPDNANVLNSLGVCFGVLQNLPKALDAFARSHAAEPTEAMPVYNEGLIHEMQGETEKARQCFVKALHLHPDSFESAFHLGKNLMMQGKTAEALPCLEKAHSLKPENGPVLKNLAEACFQHNDLTRAFALYRQALRRMPRDPGVLSGLGACFDLKGENPDIAATFCEEALKEEPDNGLFALRLARIRFRQKQIEMAQPLFRLAQKKGMVLTESEETLLENNTEESSSSDSHKLL
ncbi:tetratricopeptide repeat protein [Desulfobotulus sp. H1]|uniref:Tetratricopeptide repeat protein n=1 Tax=Desulfobotulus pelophilus TaxID=2823377 RepID=A0ABT3N5P0_9BACT|nr:tetratricopeptide repeat protein [Desulfobotulus pelophilus]MCW7752476.1 tetratricopeptide repeat protein [Desulfobotulus pelophilus]